MATNINETRLAGPLATRLRITALSTLIGTLIAGCAAPGQQYKSNVYTASQVNQAQAAKTIEILAIMPAQIEVSNEEGKKQAMVAGALLGALAGGGIGNALQNRGGGLVGGLSGVGAGAALGGALAPEKVLVEGVQLTYVADGQTLNSAQVGKMCEFKTGTAILVSTAANETRVQPNSQCPVEKPTGGAAATGSRP